MKNFIDNLTISKNPKPLPDIEPVLVRQTAEPEHCENPREWFADVASDAAVEFGCAFFRYSLQPSPIPAVVPPEALVKPPVALLVEGWTERPADQREPRWMLTQEEGQG